MRDAETVEDTDLVELELREEDALRDFEKDALGDRDVVGLLLRLGETEGECDEETLSLADELDELLPDSEGLGEEDADTDTLLLFDSVDEGLRVFLGLRVFVGLRLPVVVNEAEDDSEGLCVSVAALEAVSASVAP